MFGFLGSSGKSEDLTELFPQPHLTTPSRKIHLLPPLKGNGQSWVPTLPLLTALASLFITALPLPFAVCHSMWHLFL